MKRHEGFLWSASCRVHKYSKDQTAWLISRGVRNPKFVHFNKHSMVPEDGVLDVPGNLATNGGLANLTALMTATGGLTFSATQGICGVGAVATPAQVTDTVLGGNGSSTTAWYQIVDAAPTVSGGLVQAVSTFGPSEANFGWNEWCWAVGTTPVVAGPTLASVGGSAVMLNHKVTGLGTKEVGASWSLQTSVTISSAS